MSDRTDLERRYHDLAETTCELILAGQQFALADTERDRAAALGRWCLAVEHAATLDIAPWLDDLLRDDDPDPATWTQPR